MTPARPATREVRAELALEASAPADLVLSVAVADGYELARERLELLQDGRPLGLRELAAPHGTRLHRVQAGPGLLELRYEAVVRGRAAAAPVDELDGIRYLRPSRYVESDTLTAFARERFGGLEGLELLAAVEEWVHGALRYEATGEEFRGGAVATLESGRGVCRDFAHLVAALLRARDLPARIVSVYAPGLQPMDFHAVVEALVDGRWLVVDATRLAPRRDLVRISTGRDAADNAFLTNTLSDVGLLSLAVEARAGEPSLEDVAAPVELT